MPNSQRDYDNTVPEDCEPPSKPEPKQSVEDETADELLAQQYIPAMNNVTWEDLVVRVAQHPDFGDALADLVRGECAGMRHLTRSIAVSMVRYDMEWKDVL